MKRRLPSLVVLLGAALLCAGAAGLLFSRTYWGYWIEPPVLATAGELAELESFSALWPEGAYGPQPPAGLLALETAARYGAERDPSFPIGRVPFLLWKRNLRPRGPAEVPRQYFSWVMALLERQGLLAAGERGYRQQAKVFESAYLALGRTRRGERVLLISTHGGQVSNDHYPYYEVAFSVGRSGDSSGELALREYRHFFYDVAGIEGLTAFWMAAWLAVPLAVLAVLVRTELRAIRPAMRKARAVPEPS